MKPILTLAILFFSALNAHAIEPLDLDYKASGNNETRPSLIFNDGINTYIQPKDGQFVSIYNATSEGPYLVVSGTPASISATVNGKPITIEKLGASKKKINVTPVELPVVEKQSIYPSRSLGQKKSIDFNVGDSLQKVIGLFCEHHNIRIDWQSSSDFVIKKKMTINGNDPVKLLQGFLRDAGYEVGGNESLVIVADRLE